MSHPCISIHEASSELIAGTAACAKPYGRPYVRASVSASQGRARLCRRRATNRPRTVLPLRCSEAPQPQGAPGEDLEPFNPVQVPLALLKSLGFKHGTGYSVKTSPDRRSWNPMAPSQNTKALNTAAASGQGSPYGNPRRPEQESNGRVRFCDWIRGFDPTVVR